MFLNYDGIGQVCASFNCNTNITAGAPCTLTTAKTVATAREDEFIFGQVLSVHNGVANVAVKGFMTFRYTGSTPGIGYVPLCGDGAGGISICSDCQSYWVVAVDSVNKTATVLL